MGSLSFLACHFKKRGVDFVFVFKKTKNPQMCRICWFVWTDAWEKIAALFFSHVLVVWCSFSPPPHPLLYKRI